MSASKVIHCCHCNGPVRVSIKAISVSCPHCHQRVALENVIVRGAYTGRTLVTCGDVLIEETGRITVPIRAQNVTVNGIVRAPVVAIGTLAVGAVGRIVGDVQAGRLDVAEGGAIAGACRIVSIAPPAPQEMPQTASAMTTAVIEAPTTMPSFQPPSSAPVLRPVPHNPVRRPRGM